MRRKSERKGSVQKFIGKCGRKRMNRDDENLRKARIREKTTTEEKTNARKKKN